MKYCPYCGTGLQDDMAFCPKCGKKFTSATENDTQSQANETPIVNDTPKKKSKALPICIALIVIIGIAAYIVLGGGGKLSKVMKSVANKGEVIEQTASYCTVYQVKETVEIESVEYIGTILYYDFDKSTGLEDLVHVQLTNPMGHCVYITQLTEDTCKAGALAEDGEYYTVNVITLEEFYNENLYEQQSHIDVTSIHYVLAKQNKTLNAIQKIKAKDFWDSKLPELLKWYDTWLGTNCGLSITDLGLTLQ